MRKAVSHSRTHSPTRQLSMFDSICIMVGIVIGAGIYETSPFIASLTSSPWQLILVWINGGLIALMGALCYAELSTAYPHEGGDYVFLSRAYGSRLGFLFAWCEYWIIRPGNVGMMAFVFGRFATNLFPLGVHRRLGGAEHLDFMVYGCGAILVLTAANLLGVAVGKMTQNALTTIKVAGLLVIIAVGLLAAGHATPPPAGAGVAPEPGGDYRLALILVLFTYGGWGEMSYVAAEVRDPNRNLVRSLIFGSLLITLIYVSVNLAFLQSLGLDGTSRSQAIAADVLKLRFGDVAGAMMSVLVCVSCLGAINGMLFTGSRVFFAAGRDHHLIAWLGKWNATFDTPLRALVLQLMATLGLVIGFGWYENGFESLLHFSAPVFWAFAALVGVSLFLLRWKEPDVTRPYRVVLFPLVPILFCISCGFLFYSSFTYALSQQSIEASWTLAILAVGVVVSFWSVTTGRATPGE